MCGLDMASKVRFAAARYMDDILLIYDKRAIWNSARFLADFGASECYHPPLKLEPGNDGIFWKTSFMWVLVEFATSSRMLMRMVNVKYGGTTTSLAIPPTPKNGLRSLPP